MINKVLTIMALLLVAISGVILAIHLNDKFIIIMVVVFSFITALKCIDDLFNNDKNLW